MIGAGAETTGDVWRERFQRFGRSGLVVAQFCSREGVSVASFYYWRKKLGSKTPPPHTSTRRRPAGHDDVAPPPHTTRRRRPAGHDDVAPPPHLTSRRHPAGDQPIMTRRGVFRPVAIISPSPGPTPLAAGVHSTAGVLIVLPCGTRIEVGTEHLDALRAVVAEVVRGPGRVRVPACGEEGGGMAC